MKISAFFAAFCLALFNIVLSQAPGSGNCIDFGATNDYVSIPNTAVLNTTTAVSLEAWIKADSWNINSYGNVIISKDGWGSGEGGYTLRCGANGTLSFNIGTTTSWKEVVSTPQMALNTWTHVAGTFDGTQLKIYINGILSGTTNYTGAILSTTYDLVFGRITYTSGGTRNFDGKIDEVRVWSTGISQANIQEWMTKKISPSHPNYANLIGNWRMDEGTGATTADAGPNNLTGNRIGTTWAVSGAAIGDYNAFAYGTPASVTLFNPDGTQFIAAINGGAPVGVHVYAVGQSPNVTTEALSGSLESSRYFGTFLVGGTNPKYTATYRYGGNAALDASSQEQDIRLTYRNDNSSTSWLRLNNQFQTDTVANSTFKCGITTRREFAAGFDSTEYGLTQGALCQGDTFTYFGQQITTAGLHTHVTTAANGCDSTVGVFLTLNLSASGSDSATICSGDSVLFAGQVLSTTGIYTGVFNSANGCDSIVQFSLTVNAPFTTNTSETICEGDTVFHGSQVLTQPGTYPETFSAINGCDSLVVLTLSFHAVDTSVLQSGITLTANQFSNSYQWLVCDNNFAAIPGATQQSFTPGVNGSYAVVVSDGVCSDTSSCHFVLAVGIAHFLASKVAISPNPTHGSFQIQRLDGTAIGDFRVMGIDGKQVFVGHADVDQVEIGLETMPKGMYFLEIALDGRHVMLKVIKD